MEKKTKKETNKGANTKRQIGFKRGFNRRAYPNHWSKSHKAAPQPRQNGSQSFLKSGHQAGQVVQKWIRQRLWGFLGSFALARKCEAKYTLFLKRSTRCSTSTFTTSAPGSWLKPWVVGTKMFSEKPRSAAGTHTILLKIIDSRLSFWNETHPDWADCFISPFHLWRWIQPKHLQVYRVHS